MFVQHKQLTHLSVSYSKVVRLHISAGPLQLAFDGHRPQLSQAFLVRVQDKGKNLIVVAFHLMVGHENVFFVPGQGEVEANKSEAIYKDGFRFIESMGFFLSDTDYHLMSVDEQKDYWYRLPITQPPQLSGRRMVVGAGAAEKKRLREASLANLGRFLATF